MQHRCQIVPSQVQFRPIKKVAFACNYHRKDLQTPVALSNRRVQFTGANLYVIHVERPSEVTDEDAQSNKHVLQQNLADLKPVYFELPFANVIAALTILL